MNKQFIIFLSFSIFILIGAFIKTSCNRKDTGDHEVSRTGEKQSDTLSLNTEETESEQTVEKEGPDDGFIRAVNYGGPNYDQANCIAALSDGSYAVLGSSNAGEDGNVVKLIKFNRDLDIIWEKQFDYGLQSGKKIMTVTRDGGFVTAVSSTFVDKHDPEVFYKEFLVVKLNRKGEIVWEQNISDDGVHFTVPEVIIQTDDGGYVTAGKTSIPGDGNKTFLVIMKLDEEGVPVWNKTFKEDEYRDIFDVVETQDKGIAAAGSLLRTDSDFNDLWIVKLDSSGKLLWEKSYGEDWTKDNTGYADEEARAIIENDKGELIVAGITTLYSEALVNMYCSYIFIKLTSTGDKILRVPAVYEPQTELYSIIQDIDGNYVAVGSRRTEKTNSADILIMKFNGEGELLDEKAFGGEKGETAYSVIQDVEGSYAAAGYTFSFGEGGRDYQIVKFDF